MSSVNIEGKFLTNNESIQLYNHAINLFQAGNYVEAKDILSMVISSLSRSENHVVYSKALAGCYQALEQYEDAIIHYKFTCVMDFLKNEHNDCLFYIGVCNYNLGNVEIARKNFADFEVFASEYPKLLTRLALYKKLLQQG